MRNCQILDFKKKMSISHIGGNGRRHSSVHMKHSSLFSLSWLVVALAAVGAETQIDIKLDCQTGWTRLGHKCYRLYTDPLPWATSERVCESYGGVLAAPMDYWDNEEIGTFVTNRSGLAEFWLGKMTQFAC
ncbi:unnamed protein product [Lymnaea stagnalis]|uniref:C-type lectin domain-containing protein n=1 Tax=Lymnaea stagnalis TaxID=6523 RepID=A0AAV2H2X5_LYMST